MLAAARKSSAKAAPAVATASLTLLPSKPTRFICPLRDQSLDLIVTAFGFRNLANYEAGLREFLRVLKPGGQLGILEFSEPGGLIGKAYAVYFRRVLPAIGRLICGAKTARITTCLPRSATFRLRPTCST